MRSFLVLVLGMCLCVGDADARPGHLGDDGHLILSDEERKDVLVLHDEGGRYFVVSKPDGKYAFFYYGDSSVLHRVPVNAHGSSPGGGAHAYYWGIPHHRLVGNESRLDGNEELSHFVLRCGNRRTKLSLADAKSREEVLKGEYRAATWQRYPYLLSRDSRGVYYYVDGHTQDARDLRLFIGRAGNMKRAKLTDLVTDSEGDILFSKAGKLRIDGRFGTANRKATWISGKSRKTLRYLGEQRDQKLIYNELGVYDGDHLGTPCEDF